MHKNYEEPLVKILYLKARDPITTSGVDTEDPDGANDGYEDDFLD